MTFRNLIQKPLQQHCLAIINKKSADYPQIFLPYRNLREIKTHETMFVLIESATWVKRHASFLYCLQAVLIWKKQAQPAFLLLESI